jgi:hypothetical protein
MRSRGCYHRILPAHIIPIPSCHVDPVNLEDNRIWSDLEFKMLRRRKHFNIHPVQGQQKKIIKELCLQYIETIS